MEKRFPEPDDAPEVRDGDRIVMITAWMTPFREAMRNQSVKKTLSIPAWLNEEAERRNVEFFSGAPKRAEGLRGQVQSVRTGRTPPMALIPGE